MMYRGEIGARQLAHLPRRASQERMGMFCHHLIGALHFGQCDGGRTIDSPRGTRQATTFRNEAIEALGWFDKKTIPEMFGFLGSDSEDVRESAADEILDALDDSSLSDREISSMLVNMAKVLNDEDILDDAFASFMDMRNSVAVQTIKEISLTGTPTAQKLMADVIEDVTDKDDIRTFKQLDDWLQANPDDEDDGDLFDGDKDDDDDKTDDDDDDQG